MDEIVIILNLMGYCDCSDYVMGVVGDYYKMVIHPRGKFYQKVSHNDEHEVFINTFTSKTSRCIYGKDEDVIVKEFKQYLHLL